MNNFSRESGVLLHLTSLPGPHGIGDLGQSAFQFIDQLEQMGQKLWQILPSGQPDNCYSPYSTISAFCNNPLLISLDLLCEDGYIEKKELNRCPDFPKEKVDYKAVELFKIPLLQKAAERFQRNATSDEIKPYQSFCNANNYWLDDYTLFIILRSLEDGKQWSDWSEAFAMRDAQTLAQIRLDYYRKIENIKILQYFFYMQWRGLKEYANKQGIRIIGDIPIYISYNSADVWSNRNLFKLDGDGRMMAQSGCPPDDFIKEGQIWGHPIYNWAQHKDSGYEWWIARLKYLFEFVNIIRIDHFNGFAKYWEVNVDDSNGMRGQWIEGPGEPFFQAVNTALGDRPIIAENLGEASINAAPIMEKFNIPGIIILQMTFKEKEKPSPVSENMVVYTGTHDNDTIIGRFNSMNSNGHPVQSELELKAERDRALSFFNSDGSNIHWNFIKLALDSEARMVITPLQDILGLGTESRMNIPGTVGNNWEWRYSEDLLLPEMVEKMRSLIKNSGRI